MKFNFKKVLTAVAIGFTATFQLNSNLNVSANCPTIIDSNKNSSTDKLLVLTCGEKEEGKGDIFVFGVPIESSTILKNIKNNNLTAKTKNGEKTISAKLELRDLGTKDESLEELVFEMPASELTDGTYNFEIYDGENLVGTFEKINLRKDDYKINDSETLEFFDKTIVTSTADNKKTNDHLEGCYEKSDDKINHEFNAALIPDLKEITELSKKVNNDNRQSILKDLNEIKLIYKNKKNNEKVLEKTSKLKTKEIKNIKNEKVQLKFFGYNLTDSEISFGETYSVDILENGKLIGNFDHELVKKFPSARG